MSTNTTSSGTIIWVGRPWILPAAVIRTILVLIAAIVIVWLENLANVAGSNILGMSLWTWTALLFLVVWLISFVQLLLLRAAHKYTLRADGLEVRTGIASLNTFVLAPTGFSDLQVNQSLVGRMVGYGDITIRTQGERTATMQKVKSPVKVADQLRKIMGKPIVRIEAPPPPSAENE